MSIDRSPGFHEGWRRGRAYGRRQGRKMWFYYGLLCGVTGCVLIACATYAVLAWPRCLF